MRAARGSVGLLMAGVAVMALDLAVFRALRLDPASNQARYHVPVDATRAIPFATFSLGMLPMASLLLLVAAAKAPEVLRRGTCSGFGLGFLLAGSAAVFGFMAVAALSPAAIHGYLNAAVEPMGAPLYRAFGPRLPEAFWDGFEVMLGVALLTAPELAVAALGGWLTRRAARGREATVGSPSPIAVVPLV